MTITVVVPTYRRPADLDRCLGALALQTRLADETLVVLREGDDATSEMLAKLDPTVRSKLSLRQIVVSEQGLVYALNVALDSISTQIMAITDDDAAPFVDWIERIEKHYEAREEVGGVGGRDMLFDNGRLHEGQTSVVGKLRYGRNYVGNHHLGVGPARDVDMLKGVNCSYRMSAIAPIGFDRRLRGTGAQVHYEIALGIRLRRAGWCLVYDPRILVNHYTARRHDEDQRASFNKLAAKNRAFNETLVRLEFSSRLERIAFMLWSLLVGSRMTPGLVQIVRLYREQGSVIVSRARSTAEGRFAALLALSVRRDDVNSDASTNRHEAT